MMRLTILSKVVLPQPEGPRRTTNWPSSTVNEQSSTAERPPPPYRLTTCSKTIALIRAGAYLRKPCCVRKFRPPSGILMLDRHLAAEVGDRGVGQSWAR